MITLEDYKVARRAYRRMVIAHWVCRLGLFLALSSLVTAVAGAAANVKNADHGEYVARVGMPIVLILLVSSLVLNFVGVRAFRRARQELKEALKK